MSRAAGREETWQLGGVEITVTRKRIKNLYLRVRRTDGAVAVSAPLYAERGEIERFLHLHRAWLEQRREAALRQPAPTAPRYVTGEELPLWGRGIPLSVRRGQRTQAAYYKEGRLLLYLAAGSTAEARAALVRAWYRRQLAQAISGLRERCEAIMGRTASEYRIRDMKTRWGTCNTQTGRIWLNLQLAKYPPECLEYVMLHELAHLWERGHNARFYGILDRACPDWRRIRQELNRLAAG